jgi:hypothetical protein
MALTVVGIFIEGDVVVTLGEVNELIGFLFRSKAEIGLAETVCKSIEDVLSIYGIAHFG